MSLLSSPHTHSNFCDGKNSLREMVLAAIDKGFYSIGFSGHSFTPHDTECPMSPSDTIEYIKEVRLLKQEFKDKIHIRLGIELDMTSKMDLSPFDYVIGSVHYLYDEKNQKYWCIDNTYNEIEDCVKYMFGGDSMAMVKCYYETAQKMALSIKPDIIGHYDLITKLNKDQIFDESSDEYKNIALSHLEKIARTGAVFELNSGGIFRGYTKVPYPAPFILERLFELGASITISSDAHSADALGFYHNESIELLNQIGFKQVKVLSEKGFISKSI